MTQRPYITKARVAIPQLGIQPGDTLCMDPDSQLPVAVIRYFSRREVEEAFNQTSRGVDLLRRVAGEPHPGPRSPDSPDPPSRPRLLK